MRRKVVEITLVNPRRAAQKRDVNWRNHCTTLTIVFQAFTVKEYISVIAKRRLLWGGPAAPEGEYLVKKEGKKKIIAVKC